MENARTDIAIQPPGLAVLWTSIGLAVFGLFALSAGTILVGILGLLFLGICHVLASRHLDGIEISRPLPSRAFVGRSFPIEATLTNTQRRISAVEFRLEDPLASLRIYTSLSIPPLGGQAFRYPGKCLRRGVIRQYGWTILSTSPLGLYQSVRRGKFTESAPILALPRPYLHERLRHHLESELLGGALLTNTQPDSADEFRLLREFRSGDPIRAIHWPSSLRATQLQVRQTDPPTPKPPRTCLVLHSYDPPRNMATPETFELILRIAAGLLVRFRDSETEIDFHILPRDPIRLRHRHDFDAALDKLALLERKPIRNLPVELSKIERREKTYILGDSPVDGWESVARSASPNAVCIDTAGLTTRPLSLIPPQGLAS